MEYHLTNLPKSEVEIQVTLPFSELEPHVKRAAALISEEMEIKGFRRGKAPYDVVRERVGEGKIYETASELAVKKTYPEIVQKIMEEYEVQKKEFIPIGRPEVAVAKLAPGNDFEFKVRLAILPEITLPNYKEIAARAKGGRKEVSVTDEEISKTLDWIQESRSKLVTVDRPAQSGDAVEVDFEVRNQGVKIEEGDSKNHPLVIGKSKFIPGFEDNLIGMQSGEEKKFTLAIPEDWYEKSLAGRSLDFAVKLKLVQERQRAALDDAFAQSLGSFSSLAALKQNVKDGIQKEKEEKETQRRRSQLIDEIGKEMKAEIPEVLIDSEIEKMSEELKSGVEAMGMKWEDYLLHVKKTSEEIRKDWRGEAGKRVRAALALRAIAVEEGILVNENEIEERANKFLQQYGSPEEAGKNIDPVELREYTRGVLRNEKVFKFLEEVQS